MGNKPGRHRLCPINLFLPQTRHLNNFLSSLTLVHCKLFPTSSILSRMLSKDLYQSFLLNHIHYYFFFSFIAYLLHYSHSLLLDFFSLISFSIDHKIPLRNHQDVVHIYEHIHVYNFCIFKFYLS